MHKHFPNINKKKNKSGKEMRQTNDPKKKRKTTEPKCCSSVHSSNVTKSENEATTVISTTNTYTHFYFKEEWMEFRNLKQQIPTAIQKKKSNRIDWKRHRVEKKKEEKRKNKPNRAKHIEVVHLPIPFRPQL